MRALALTYHNTPFTCQPKICALIWSILLNTSKRGTTHFHRLSRTLVGRSTLTLPHGWQAKFGWSHTIWMESYNLDGAIQFGWSHTIWMKPYNLDEVIQFGWSHTIWMESYNLHEAIQFGWSHTIWMEPYNLDGIIQFGLSNTIWMESYNFVNESHYSYILMCLILMNIWNRFSTKMAFTRACVRSSRTYVFSRKT
jgi:hypothetical protein